MYIRKAISTDTPEILKIFKSASEFIKSYGSNQWQGDSMPNALHVEDDIKKSQAYVLIDNDSENILAYMCVSFLGDPNYAIIKQGRWESDYSYGVIHRIAISQENRGKNFSKLLFDFAEKLCKENHFRSIRIDTHELNFILKHIVKKRKYKYCGIIFLENGEERLAYEKILIPYVKGDLLSLKKNHPCGNNIFKILRVGMDFRLECIHCHSQIWLSRADLNRRLKKRLTKVDIANLQEKNKI